MNDWREVLAELREAHAEEIDPAVYAAVRARVLAELRPRRRWGWVWAAAGVTAALVLGVEVRERMRVEELAARTIVAAAPPTAPHEVAVKRKGGRAKREEIVMKIETSQPDVVIYWIAEVKGED